MNENNRNIILAIVLSALVLIGWQFFIAGPQMERARQQAELAAQQQQGQVPADTSLAAPGGIGTAGAPAAAAPGTFATREAAIDASPRVAIDTPALAGSINLTGGRIDDLRLKQYRETVEPNSPIITLLSPAGAPGGYFTEQGWVPASGTTVPVPTDSSVWTVEGDAAALTQATPVTLRFDNGAGLVFRRTFAVDEHFLFTVTQSVENGTGTPVVLYPYARVVREGTPPVHNFWIQHEGPLAVLGANNLVSRKYGDLQKEQQLTYENTSGWIGITDKYWATTVIADPKAVVNARMFWSQPTAGQDVYRMSLVQTEPVTVAPSARAETTSYVFAGAKEEAVIAGYESAYGFDRLELLIDWGWLHFLTQPMFHVLRFIYSVVGNFGVSILILTLMVKLILFPLANKSYASMAGMRKMQPQMKALQERYKDDRPALQQAMMEIYKKEKINPISGCWPMLIQIPVFFALYTILFISLEMRHAPFFGWIVDLASPDPTNIFTLFGLIPWNPQAVPVIGSFLHLGVWPLVMGVTMWLQMQLNPPPPDPAQAAVFAWMPVIFTFMLGSFPAGLVIYWAWNNTLTLIQQSYIMHRHGSDVNLFSNVARTFRRKPKESTGKAGS